MKKILSVLLYVIPMVHLFAQENTVAAGGNASGSGGSTSFSVGQVFYMRLQDDSFSTVEGLQQPIEIIPLAVSDFENNPLVKIFPNPTFSGFYISLPDADYTDSSYVLYDPNGKLVAEGKITTDETFVKTDAIVSGIYLLKLTTDGKENGYKIIKR